MRFCLSLSRFFGALFISTAMHVVAAQAFLQWPAAPSPTESDSSKVLVALAPPSMNAAPINTAVTQAGASTDAQPVFATDESAQPSVEASARPTPAPPQHDTLPEEESPSVEPDDTNPSKMARESRPQPSPPQVVECEASDAPTLTADSSPTPTQADPRLARAQEGRAVRDYRTTIRAMLSDAKRYPSSARRLRMQGLVVVEYDIDAQGRARAVHVAESSGHRSLDQETIRLIKSTSPYLPPPGGSIHLRFPFRYSLTTIGTNRSHTKNSAHD